MQNSSSPATPSLPTPTLKRRLIAMVYEAFLLAAVEFFGVLLYLLVARYVFGVQDTKANAFQHGLSMWIFLVAAAYFIHCWVDSGHTLAMKTWRIKLVKPGCARVPPRVALGRFLLACGWFLPAAILIYALKLTGKAEVFALFAINLAAWAMTAFLDTDRQFLHDKLMGTRLIQMAAPAKRGAKA
ncbi:MAG: RDD family protein [Pseudomonadota bacterium]